MPPERSAGLTTPPMRASLATRFEPIVVWLAPLGLVLLWQVVVRRVDPGGILPSPVGVGRGLVELLADGRLHRALLHSSVHILTGFGLATAAAIPLGTLTAMSGRAEEWLRPLVETFRPIAPYAWVPMAILWLGFGSPTVVAIVSYAAFFPIFVNTAEGMRRVPRGLVRAARTLGASRLAIFRRVMVPGALPLIFVGLRLGLGAAWIAVVAGELATATSGTDRAAWNGIGQMMFIFYAYSINLNYIVVGMLGVGAMALVLDAGLRRLEVAVMPWRRPVRSLGG
jgi:ABC-type nitrate/sulfonate/bicarbonate transport system permease component